MVALLGKGFVDLSDLSIFWLSNYKVFEMEGWRVDMNCSATPNDEIMK